MIDPVLVGIAAGRLHSILDEQQATLVRTAFSTIVRESEDLACGVFDTAGNMIGQSSSGRRRAHPQPPRTQWIARTSGSANIALTPAARCSSVPAK